MENIIEIPARPTWNDTMLDELAAFTAVILSNSDGCTLDEDECKEAAIEVLRHRRHDDGYELTKQFEDKGFQGSVLLVEDLDGVSSEAYDIEKAYVKKWVADNSIALDKNIGDIICFDDRGKEITAEIMQIFHDIAAYCVWWDGMGYVKGQGCRHVKYELIK